MTNTFHHQRLAELKLCTVGVWDAFLTWKRSTHAVHMPSLLIASLGGQSILADRSLQRCPMDMQWRKLQCDVFYGHFGQKQRMHPVIDRKTQPKKIHILENIYSS